MAERLIGIRIAITRCIDDSTWPSYVECEFVDAHGQCHRFAEKSAIVSPDAIDSTTIFPYPAVIACRIVGRISRAGLCDLVFVDTTLPWHVESIDEQTQFEVLPDNLIEWEFGSHSERPWNGVI